MLTTTQKQIILENMIEMLELPDSAYEKAKDRYDDIGEWLGREESSCVGYEPHVFPQGSFRLGTAIRPLDEREEYDLDLACKLRTDFTKSLFTQEALKRLIGQEVESYRIAKGIKSSKEEKHRCWRLDYQDNLRFHMDIVPCIPEEKLRQNLILESMKIAGLHETLASSIAQDSVSITDDRHPRYRQISNDWLLSNPQGYASWFESRMKQGLCENRFFAKGQVDDIPLYKRKTPLQRAIQLLKRHRNLMFKNNDDAKPISIIITTLAARAYQGELDIESALTNILSQMGDFVNSNTPKVPNPVNSQEDFADRWSMPQYKHLNLESNFGNWLAHAQADFETIGSSADSQFISEQIMRKFSVTVDGASLRKKLGLSSVGVSVVTPKKHSSPTIIKEKPKPWGRRL
jgi:hypothetical protein